MGALCLDNHAASHTTATNNINNQDGATLARTNEELHLVTVCERETEAIYTTLGSTGAIAPRTWRPPDATYYNHTQYVYVHVYHTYEIVPGQLGPHSRLCTAVPSTSYCTSLRTACYIY